MYQAYNQYGKDEPKLWRKEAAEHLPDVVSMFRVGDETLRFALVEKVRKPGEVTR